MTPSGGKCQNRTQRTKLRLLVSPGQERHGELSSLHFSPIVRTMELVYILACPKTLNALRKAFLQ